MNVFRINSESNAIIIYFSERADITAHCKRYELLISLRGDTAREM